MVQNVLCYKIKDIKYYLILVVYKIDGITSAFVSYSTTYFLK
jgi:hypothetical protein